MEKAEVIVVAEEGAEERGAAAARLNARIDSMVIVMAVGLSPTLCASRVVTVCHCSFLSFFRSRGEFIGKSLRLRLQQVERETKRDQGRDLR